MGDFHIHTVNGIEGSLGGLYVTEGTRDGAPVLEFTVRTRDGHNVGFFVASFPEVESFHSALGFWLMDKLLTYGEVARGK